MTGRGKLAPPPVASAALSSKPEIGSEASNLALLGTPDRKGPIRDLRARLEFDCVALLLQGGGALGAYQAGVYQALAEAGLHPDRVVGVSIGAVNAAIIAGNPIDRRVDKLREFWEIITASPLGLNSDVAALLGRGEAALTIANQMSAAVALMAGASGFFTPRLANPWLRAPGLIEATSYYDTGPMRDTLERLIDFDRVNAPDGGCRLSVGAVNVRSGNLVYFDSASSVIGPEHIMASGALPPGFPAVEIEGEHYWDGGLVSNTPLKWVVSTQRLPDALVFQVDLWNARGQFPRDMMEVATRQKEIQYSSRTRALTDYVRDMHKLRRSLADVLDLAPQTFRASDEGKFLESIARRNSYNLVHLIYRPHSYEGHSKDYDFSRRSMEEHWQAGFHDATRTLRHREVIMRSSNGEPRLAVFDYARDGSD